MEAELFRSATKARDVVESYRQYDLAVSQWRNRLLTASAAIARSAADQPAVAGVPLADLAQGLRDVARDGLGLSGPRLDRVSNDLQTLVTARIPGYPRPEDAF
jgi:hypothetical protein